MTEEEVRGIRKGERVYAERFGAGTVRDVWAISLDVFVDFDEGTSCYYPRRDHHLLERESAVQARAALSRPTPRLRASGLALRAA